MRWTTASALGVLAGATIFAVPGAAREWGNRPSAGLAVVSGQLTLSEAGGRAPADIGSAVVYLEVIETPRPRVVAAPPPPPPPPRPVESPAPMVDPATLTLPAAPTDTAGVLWGAVRDLQRAVRGLHESVMRRLQPGDSAARARVAAPPVDTAPLPRPAAPPPPPPPPPRAIPGAAILMKEKEFRPHVQAVEVGGTVQFPNGDPFSHNVFSNTPGGAFDLGLYPRGESRGATFRRPGTYAIFCNIHSRMSAYVVAVPTQYYAQPGPDGRFTIANVPPGRYRLRAWHERAAAPQTMTVTVTERGTDALTVALATQPVRTTAHLNKFGQPYPATRRDDY